MDIEIVLGVSANRYFQSHFRRDCYPTLNDDEKQEIKNVILSESFRKTINCFGSNNGKYKGVANVLSVDVFEKDEHLFIRAAVNFTDPDAQGFDELRLLIIDAFNHYMVSGPAGTWGDPIYFIHNEPENYNFVTDEIQEENVSQVTSSRTSAQQQVGCNQVSLLVESVTLR